MKPAASHVSLLTSAAFAALIAAASVAHAQPSGSSISAALKTLPQDGPADYRDTVHRYLEGLEPKIIGGKPAPSGSDPWQVSLDVAWIADPFRAHFCGGSILSARWIVTAAHCVDKLSPDKVIVTAGTHRLGQGGTRINVQRIFVKRGYDPSTNDSDVALLQLFQPLPLSDKGPIQPIQLLTEEQEKFVVGGGGEEVPRTGTWLRVTGWGATQENGPQVRDLRFVEVPFVERKSCNSPVAYDGDVTENMLCAGQRVGGKDSCQGDSGGPLTTLPGATRPLLAGIVSFGEGCGRAEKVGVYTRVSRFAGWIAACMASPSSCP